MAKEINYPAHDFCALRSISCSDRISRRTRRRHICYLSSICPSTCACICPSPDCAPPPHHPLSTSPLLSQLVTADWCWAHQTAARCPVHSTQPCWSWITGVRLFLEGLPIPSTPAEQVCFALGWEIGPSLLLFFGFWSCVPKKKKTWETTYYTSTLITPSRRR